MDAKAAKAGSDAAFKLVIQLSAVVNTVTVDDPINRRWYTFSN